MLIFPARNRAQEPKAEAAPTPSPSPAVDKGIQKELLDNSVILTNTDLVTLTVTVTDTYGRYVSGLNKNAFAIFDEKLPQKIAAETGAKMLLFPPSVGGVKEIKTYFDLFDYNLNLIKKSLGGQS